MDMVERACIAYNQILLNQPEDQRDQTLAMKAAIRAVLEGLEPGAWCYGDGEGSWELISDTASPFAIALVGQGYSGTPLYDLSAIKEAIE